MTPTEETMRRNELRFLRKHFPAKWTNALHVELMRLDRQAQTRQEALDAVAEANAEGRIPNYHDLPINRSRRDA